MSLHKHGKSSVKHTHARTCFKGLLGATVGSLAKGNITEPVCGGGGTHSFLWIRLHAVWSGAAVSGICLPIDAVWVCPSLQQQSHHPSMRVASSVEERRFTVLRKT